MSDKRNTHVARRGNVLEFAAFVIAPDYFSLDGERRDRASQFVDVIRADCFRVVFQQERAREKETLSRATGGLVKVVFFFKQRRGRDVFERQTILFESLALLVRVDPITRRTQWESTFDEPGDEYRAKAKTERR